MKLSGCLMLPILFVCFIGGGGAIWTAWTNKSITEITIGELEKAKPEARWLRVTKGDMRVFEAAYAEGSFDKETKEVLVPYMEAGKSADTDPIHLMVKTKRPALIRLVSNSRDLEKKLPAGASESDKLKAEFDFLREHSDALSFGQPIEGLVDFGFDAKNKEAEKLRKLFPHLAPDFIVLNEGQKPSLGVGVFLLLAGFGLAVLVFRPRRKFTQDTAAATAVSPPSGAP